MEKKLLIVDGHAYAYRAFYAIRQLTSAVTGQPTNAIYGFIRMLGKMQAFLQPTHIQVVWDGGLADARMQLLPEYKEHRAPMPALLEPQLDEIIKFLQVSNIPSYLREGVEADDWIATLARRAVSESFSVVIASADKDFLQLVGPQIGLLNPNDKEPRIWAAEDVRTKTGVDPSQIIDYLALLGDAVDNIPGVPGVGPTTAAKLINKFGSVSAIYERIEEVHPERIRAALKGAAEHLERNRCLIRLHDNLPDVQCCDDLAVKTPDFFKLKELYIQWGFKTLAQEIEKKTSSQPDLF